MSMPCSRVYQVIIVLLEAYSQAQFVAMKAWFLPIGLVVALIAGLSFPAAGTFLSTLKYPLNDGWSIVNVLVALTFVISGMQMRTDGLSQLGQYMRAIAIAVLCNIILFPLMVFTLSMLDIFPVLILVGASVMACVPTTLSSGIVISKQAGGDEALALIITVLLSIIGVCILPFSLSGLLSAGVDVSIDVYALLMKLVVLVLIPCAVGFFWRTRFGRPSAPWIGFLPSLAVILIVWIVASSKADSFTNATCMLLLSIVVISALVHMSIFLIALLLGSLCAVESKFKRSLVFTASQKTLPIAIAVLTSIEQQITVAQMGIGVMVCVLWHFTQILIDACIAARWARIAKSETSPE